MNKTLEQIYLESQRLFSDGEGESFWKKHRKKILASAAMAAAAGLGYTYREPIKREAQKAYYQYWMSEEDAKEELNSIGKIIDEAFSFPPKLDKLKAIPNKVERIVKFCIYNAGDNQPSYVKETKKRIEGYLETAHSWASRLGQSEYAKKFKGYLDELRK